MSVISTPSRSFWRSDLRGMIREMGHLCSLMQPRGAQSQMCYMKSWSEKPPPKKNMHYDFMQSMILWFQLWIP
jgi:hypothetical protein